MGKVKFEISIEHLAKITRLTKGEIMYIYEHADRRDRFVYALLCELDVKPEAEMVGIWKRIVRQCKKKERAE